MKYIYVICLLMLTNGIMAQCLSSGALPTVVRNFGTGTAQYSTSTTTDFGFTTTYKQVFGTRTGVQKDWIIDGEFAILNLTADAFFAFANKAVWHKDVPDHTGNTGGYMMAFNASIDPGEFYREEVSNLCTGVTYDFSVWLANLDVPEPTRTKPNVRFEIRNGYDNSLVADYETGQIDQFPNLQWEQHTVTFNANVDKVILLLINNNPGGKGNDLLIDDIEFKPCLPVYTVTPSVPSQLCVGDNLTLEAVDDGVGYFTPEFQWQRKDKVTGVWSDLPSETNTSLVLNNVTESDSGWYKVFIAEKGVLASIQCRSEDSFFVDIQPRLVSGKIEDNQKVCYNSTPAQLSNVTAASGAGGAFTYFWESSHDSLTWNDLGSATEDYTPSSLTQSTVFRRGVKSSCYTKYSDTVVVVVYDDLLGGEIEANQTVCADSIPVEIKNKITPIGGEMNYTYEWESSVDQFTWVGIASSNTVDYQPSLLTQDTWFRRKITDISCGTAYSNVLKASYQLTTKPVVHDIAFCQGSTVPGFLVSEPDLRWYASLADASGESTAPKIDSSIAGVTSYFVTTTENGCESEKSEIKVSIESTPQVLVNDLSICEGDSGKLSAFVGGGTAPFVYLWSPSADLSSTSQKEVIAKPNSTVEYTLKITDDNNCTSSTKSTVEVFQNPVVTLVNTALCQGESILLKPQVSGGDGSYTYSWTPASGLNSQTTSQVQANPLSSTEYTVFITDGNNCTDSAKTTVTVHPKPSVSVNDLAFCQGEEGFIDATVIGGTAPLAYQWTPSAGLSTLIGSQVKANPTVTTDYTVIVEDANLCSDTAIAEVTVYSKPKVSVSGGDICSGTPTNLEAKVVNGSSSVIQYAWSPSSGLNNTSAPLISANPTITTNYQIRIEDANACADSATITVGVTNLPKAEIVTKDTVLCVDEQYALEAFSDLSENYSYQWFYGVSTSDLSPLAETGQIAIIENEGYYAVEVRNNGFCSQMSTPVFIEVEELDLKATVDKNEIQYGDEVVLTATGRTIIEEWEWQTPDGTVDGPVIVDRPKESFVYTIIASASKCSATAEVYVDVLPPVIIPNGFSPNGDGKNDKWFIDGLNQYENAEVVVYNRWGGKVFESFDGYQESWDGTSFNGESLPVATYYYVIKTNSSKGKSFNGSVTILR